MGVAYEDKLMTTLSDNSPESRRHACEASGLLLMVGVTALLGRSRSPRVLGPSSPL
jgi:hypothetical protein